MTQEPLTVPSRAPEGWAVVSEEGVAALASPHSETRRDGDALRAGLGGEEAARILAESNSGIRPDLSRRGYRFVKRAFDIVASGAAIAVLFVPALALCAAICLKSPGAGPLYSQIRVGRLRKDGSYRLFRMWKFRSMVPNADQMLDELKERNEADGPLFKIKDDPRIIPGLGHFIRRHSIDELGQLLNVFVGDMSLIGPRPGLPSEVAQYDERAKRRLTVKPGCGGAWQAGSRSGSTFDEMVELDLGYIEHRSVGCDLKLVLGTVRAMFTGGGRLLELVLPFALRGEARGA